MAGIAAKVQTLTEQAHLSHHEVASIVGTSDRTVARWLAGEAAPQPAPKTRLLELGFVAEELVDTLHFAPEDANLWIFSPNRLLDGDRPADRIREGDYRSVHNVIVALAEGVVV